VKTVFRMIWIFVWIVVGAAIGFALLGLMSGMTGVGIIGAVIGGGLGLLFGRKISLLDTLTNLAG